MHYEQQWVDLNISKLRRKMIVSLTKDYSDDEINMIVTKILNYAGANDINGCVMDFSSIRLLDTFAFKSFVDVTKAMRLMGLNVTWASMGPSLVATMIDLNHAHLLDGIKTSVNLDEAMDYLDSVASL